MRFAETASGRHSLGSLAVPSSEANRMGVRVPKQTRPIHARWPWHLHIGRPCRWMRKGTHHYFVTCRGRWFRLTAKTWKGICVTGSYERERHPLLGHLPDLVMEYPSMGIKKRDSKAKDLKHLAAVESRIFEGLLSLVEHMCLLQYEDGTCRVPGWITIKAPGAAWAVQVKDPDTSSSFTAVGPTLDGALETAALLLSCDDAPWEADKWLADAAARAKKK